MNDMLELIKNLVLKSEVVISVHGYEETEKNPVHVVWGVSKGTKTPAVIVTAYRPDPVKWTNDFRRRKNASQKT